MDFPSTFGEKLQACLLGLDCSDARLDLNHDTRVDIGDLTQWTSWKRDILTIADLLAVGVPSTPVDNVWFAPWGASAPPLDAFEGTLEIPRAPMQGNSGSNVTADGSDRVFPGGTIHFFTSGGALVPVERDVVPPGWAGAIPAGPSYWRLIPGVGRVWSEPGDAPYTRAAFPFTLTNPYYADAHNGVATFLFTPRGASRLRLQVAQETGRASQYDYWAQLPATYAPGAIAGVDQLRAEFDAERAARTPMRPVAELEARHGVGLRAMLHGALPESSISQVGFVIGGIIYLEPSWTRRGEYPFPREMRHGSYSISKTLSLLPALLRLARLHGPGVMDERLADHVQVTATHDGWTSVTFAHCINMATGMGEAYPIREPNIALAGETAEQWAQWSQTLAARGKLDVAFAMPKYPWGPGEVIRYNGPTDFALGAALDQYLRAKRGSGAGIARAARAVAGSAPLAAAPESALWEMITREIYAPIGVRHLPTMKTVELDGSAALPYMTTGLYIETEEMARIAGLLAADGLAAGERLLDENLTREAMFKTGVAGLPTGEGNEYGLASYHMTMLRAAPFRTADGRLFSLAYAVGLGGNLIVFLPDGSVVFRWADGDDYDPYPLMRAAEAIGLFEGRAGNATAPGDKTHMRKIQRARDGSPRGVFAPGAPSR